MNALFISIIFISFHKTVELNKDIESLFVNYYGIQPQYFIYFLKKTKNT